MYNNNTNLLFKYNAHQISKYRTPLMGIATILIFIVHAPDNGVMMPQVLKTLCALGSLGVDLFLLLSGLGLWYSLDKSFADRLELKNFMGGEGSIRCWYSNRYKRILTPYLIIIGFFTIFCIMKGDSVRSSLLNFSTINFWLSHQGAWFIAMLIPLYAITPIHYSICHRTKKPLLYNLAVIMFLVLFSSTKNNFESPILAELYGNIQFVTYRLPAFFIGFILAPYAKEAKNISMLWMVFLPLIIVCFMRFLHFGYWPGFLVLPLTFISCIILNKAGQIVKNVLSFFGKISLESYLFNTTIGSVLAYSFPAIYKYSINHGGYLHYTLVLVIGTVLAYSVNKLCKKINSRKQQL